jgi:uncharacterized protein YndB with AHSA1/START domain
MGKLTLVAEPGKHDILMTREFDAPLDLVFKAFTDPALISNWWGTKNSTTVVDKLEARAGGSWRFIERDADGNEYSFRGVFHEVTAPSRLVQTFEFEGIPGHVLLETITFEEHNGKTLMKDLSVFQSVEDRDGMIQSGMESGAEESWQRLDEILKTL